MTPIGLNGALTIRAERCWKDPVGEFEYDERILSGLRRKTNSLAYRPVMTRNTNALNVSQGSAKNMGRLAEG
jgi:hypothetical protein